MKTVNFKNNVKAKYSRPMSNFRIRMAVMTVVIGVVIVSCGGGGVQQQKAQNAAVPETKTEQAVSVDKYVTNLNENWNNSNDVQSGFTKKAEEKGVGLIDFIKAMDEKIATTSNKNVSVYSLKQNKTCLTISVVFKQEEPVANMRDFVEVVNEVSQQIFVQPKLENKLLGIFLGFTPDGEAVCGFSMYPQEQVFSLMGFDFLSPKADIYRKAFDTLVKEKTGKESISELDYFIFRSMQKPDFGNLGDLCDRAIIGVAGTTMIELYTFKNGGEDAILSNKNIAETIFSAVSKSDERKQIMDTGFSVNAIWFNSTNKRIMAELARKLPSGEISVERKWYNGYSMPK